MGKGVYIRVCLWNKGDENQRILSDFVRERNFSRIFRIQPVSEEIRRPAPADKDIPVTTRLIIIAKSAGSSFENRHDLNKRDGYCTASKDKILSSILSGRFDGLVALSLCIIMAMSLTRNFAVDPLER